MPSSTLGCQENSARTFYEKKLNLQEFANDFGARLVSALILYHLERWVADHANWSSVDTKAKVVSQVQAAFNWATRRRLISQNPFAGFSLTGGNRRRPMTAEEFRKLWAACRGGKQSGSRPSSGRRLREFLLFMKLSGARPAEVRDLRWDQIDAEHDLVILEHHKTSKKTGEARVLILVRRLVMLLQTIRERDGGTGFVFQTTRGGPWSRNAPSQKLRRLRKRAGIPDDAVLYGLRHRFATTALLRGLDLKIVATLMGHRTTRMTEHYVHAAKAFRHLHGAMEQATSHGNRDRAS